MSLFFNLRLSFSVMYVFTLKELLVISSVRCMFSDIKTHPILFRSPCQAALSVSRIYVNENVVQENCCSYIKKRCSGCSFSWEEVSVQGGRSSRLLAVGLQWDLKLLELEAERSSSSSSSSVSLASVWECPAGDLLQTIREQDQGEYNHHLCCRGDQRSLRSLPYFLCCIHVIFSQTCATCSRCSCCRSQLAAAGCC